MEYTRIREEEAGMKNLTHEDLVRMGLARKGKWQYTLADIEALPEEIWAELIDGELFIRMEGPETDHQDILTGLLVQIDLYIQRKKGKCRVFPAPFNVYIKNDKHNFVLPDIALICDDEKIDRKGCHGAPDFVVEIVSPSNRKMDYVRKVVLYREAGVREYWIVDPKHRQVTVYDLEHDAEPVLYPFTERIRVVVYDDLYLDLTNLHGTFEEVLIEERQNSRTEGVAEGLKKGRAEGEERLAGLSEFLMREGRMDDLARALTDSAYREKLYRQIE